MNVEVTTTWKKYAEMQKLLLSCFRKFISVVHYFNAFVFCVQQGIPRWIIYLFCLIYRPPIQNLFLPDTDVHFCSALLLVSVADLSLLQDCTILGNVNLLIIFPSVKIGLQNWNNVRWVGFKLLKTIVQLVNFLGVMIGAHFLGID